MPFVLDTSVVLAWLLQEHAATAVQQWMERVRSDAVAVPPLWTYEVANGLLMSERRGRITPTDAARFLAQLEVLPIAFDDESTRDAVDAAMDLARQHGLTVYDAAYLELAVRRRLPLATLDTALTVAARRAGVELDP